MDRMASYLGCYSDAVKLSSADLGWRGITVNLDHFMPFERESLRYQEHHICVNIGARAARLEYEADGCKFDGPIPQRAFLVTPAGQPVRWHLKDETHALSIRLQDDLVQRVAESKFRLNRDRIELQHRLPIRDSRIMSIVRSLHDELQVSSRDGLHIDGLATVLAYHFLRNCAASIKSTPKERRFSDEGQQAVIRYIQEQVNIGSVDLGLDKLAQIAGVNSRYTFLRLFANSIGLTPHKYVIQQRLERAKQLLRRGSWTISEIALDVGFFDQSHLDREFKKAFGFSPSAFRDQI